MAITHTWVRHTNTHKFCDRTVAVICRQREDKEIYEWHEGITAHSRLTGTLQLIEAGVPKSPPGFLSYQADALSPGIPLLLEEAFLPRGQETRLHSRGLDLGTPGRMLMENCKESILMENMSFEK